jgi:kynurenine 3-monooxygenase
VQPLDAEKQSQKEANTLAPDLASNGKKEINMAEKVAVIGAGLVGSLQAIYLAKRGLDVTVFERRPDLRKAEILAGRSINLALSNRGWKALEGVGIADEIMKMAIPMTKRTMHSVEGELTHQPYGKEGEAIYSVSRGGLNQKLMNLADEYESISYQFDLRCDDIDLNTNTIHFTHSETGEEVTHQFDRIFGTDGAFSAVRTRLQKTERFNYSQGYLEHGYKELIIPANEDGSHKLDKNALHIWPRGEFMLIALANLDGSFTVTLFFPFKGETSFEAIKTEEDVMSFFNTTFPDAVPLMPTLVHDYFGNPSSSLVIIKCMPWNYNDKVVMMGDASHAIVPFYGQGMNAGFEDCTIFDKVFDEQNGDWGKVFKEFSIERKPDADAISDLALRNFIEMRDLTGDPKFLLRKKIERKFSTNHPDKWMPLYSQVTFSHIPYSQAVETARKQDAIMEKVMSRPNINEDWESENVENEILSLL